MMNSVVLWSVEDVLQRSQIVHALCVDPELKQSVELNVHQD